MTTLVTGAGLVGTAYAKEAAKRGEKVVFLDPIPREDYLAKRLGGRIGSRSRTMSVACLP